MGRKFEVTQFFQICLAAKYFVKRGQFTKLELRHLHMLRQQLNKKFPQRKGTKNPASWRLSVETFDGEMRGQIFVLMADCEPFNVTAFGTVEVLCGLLWKRLSSGT